ncbi:glutaredoxin domain-containing protein [uncultured Rothia sp.]|uniref:glutaredoxin domain-containing protein n=1 Tax=uncultured Rothia sp. TaxID=316088 RepID=UPI003217C3C5
MARTQATQAEAEKVIDNGGVVIYWRPGCPFCERLDSGLGETGDQATWVNIWEDEAAEAFVKSVNDGNAVVPTVTNSEKSFVASSPKAPKIVSLMIEKSKKQA